MKISIILASFILFLTVLFVGCSGYGSDYTEEIFSSDSYSYDSSSSYKGSSSSSNGSSSSSATGSCSSESDPDLDESSSSEEIKIVPDLEFDKNLNATVKLDSVWYKGNYTKTIQVGNFIWTTENANYYPTWKTSKCYDVENSNCDKYGYLYREWKSETLCPDSFSIASTTAWESLLENVGSSLKYIKSSTLWNGSANGTYALNLVPGGTCNGSTCTDAGKKAYYIGEGNSSKDSKIYIIGDDGYTIKPVSEFSDSSYFSVRCVRETFQVLKGSDLSVCDTKNKVFVKEDSSTYTCVYGKWFKEVYREPECGKSNEGDTYYKNRPYVCEDGDWREITELEARIGYCSKANLKDTIAYKDTTYICDTLSWRKRTLNDAHGQCTDAKAGDSIYYEGTNYVCKSGYWLTFNDKEKRLGLCNKKRLGELVIENDSYLICKDYEWKSTYDPEDVYGKCDTTKTDSVYNLGYYDYICKGGTWVSANAKEIALGVCNGKTQGTVKHTDTTTYVCDKGTWRTASVEEAMGKCTAALQDTVYVDTATYACNNLQWQKLTVPVSSFPYCTKKNNGAKKISSSKYYICEDYVWNKVDRIIYLYGYCNEKSLNDIRHPSSDSLGYQCRQSSSGEYSWVKLTLEEDAGKCTASIQDSIFLSYICDKGKWRELKAEEKKLGICTDNNIGDMIASGSKYYRCYWEGWSEISEQDYTLFNTPCTEENDSMVVKTNSFIYICSEGKWTQPLSIGSCSNAEDYGRIKFNDFSLYSCIGNSRWELLEDVIYSYGICTQKREGMHVQYNKYFRVCKNHFWDITTQEEYFKSIPCSETISMSGLKYTCKNDVWTPTYGSYTDTRTPQQTYRTLKVGEKTWMVDNMNYSTTDSWCYGGSADKCDTYGRLYTWNDAQTVCPTGWHPADISEYRALNDILPRIELKDNDYWQSSPTSQDIFKGFEFRGGGIRVNGSFEYEKRVAGFWLRDSSTTSADSAFAIVYGVEGAQNFTPTLNYIKVDPKDSKSYSAYSLSKATGLSVRCVKD